MATTVAPGQLAIVQLPWIQAVSQVNQANHAPAIGHSVLAHNAAYHLAYNVPRDRVRLRRAELPGRAPCALQSGHGPHVLLVHQQCVAVLVHERANQRYTVLTWPSETTQYMGSVDPTFGGFVTIIGTSSTPDERHDPSHGQCRRGHERVGDGGGRNDHADTRSRAMYSNWSRVRSRGARIRRSRSTWTSSVIPSTRARPTQRTIFTGSIITADQPVAVFGGHDCANVPYDKAACDHLEEELFPNETLGQHYLVSYTQPQLSPREPNQVRVMSNHAGNTITFTPASVHSPVTLDRGAFIDFVQTADFEVQGSGSFAIAQFSVGENYNGNSSAAQVRRSIHGARGPDRTVAHQLRVPRAEHVHEELRERRRATRREHHARWHGARRGARDGRRVRRVPRGHLDTHGRAPRRSSGGQRSGSRCTASARTRRTCTPAAWTSRRYLAARLTRWRSRRSGRNAVPRS